MGASKFVNPAVRVRVLISAIVTVGVFQTGRVSTEGSRSKSFDLKSGILSLQRWAICIGWDPWRRYRIHRHVLQN